MARRLAAMLLIACGIVVAAAAQPAPKPPCEPRESTAPRPAVDLIESARCYDDRWAFTDAERLLAASIVAIESQRAAAPDEIVPSGPVFVGGDVRTPALSKPVVGEYPADAAAHGIKGVVVVGVTLRTDGSVRAADVVESISALDQAALAIVRKMKFKPTLVAGKPVEVSFYVPARFGLGAEATPADWMVLAKSYLTHAHPAAALETLNLAVNLEHKDIARFGAWTASNGRQGGYMRSGAEPQRTHYEAPIYPPDALKARISGLVIIEALVDLDGRVGRARVLRPLPGLDAAALDAVSKWTYTPTLADGKPVSVVLTVSVSFAVK